MVDVIPQGRVCLDRLDNQAGMDSAWEQGKPEAMLREMLVVGAADWASELPASIAQSKRIGA